MRAVRHVCVSICIAMVASSAAAATVDLHADVLEGVTAFLSVNVVNDKGDAINAELTVTVDDLVTGTRLYGPVSSFFSPSRIPLPPEANRVIGYGRSEKHLISLRYFLHGAEHSEPQIDYAIYTVTNREPVHVEYRLHE